MQKWKSIELTCYANTRSSSCLCVYLLSFRLPRSRRESNRQKKTGFRVDPPRRKAKGLFRLSFHFLDHLLPPAPTSQVGRWFRDDSMLQCSSEHVRKNCSERLGKNPRRKKGKDRHHTSNGCTCVFRNGTFSSGEDGGDH